MEKEKIIKAEKLELKTGVIVGNNITEEDVRRVTGNRAIALFMGADVDENNSQVVDHFKDESGKLITKYVMGKYYFLSDKPDAYDKVVNLWDMKYHTSWDWLMPVVEKISEHHYPDYWRNKKPADANDYDDCAFMRTFGMRNDEGKYMVRINAQQLFYGATLIQATYLAVIDFIQWYTTTQQH